MQTVIFLIAIGLLLLPFIVAYGMKHEDPMEVFDTLSEEQLDNKSQQYVNEGIFVFSVNPEQNDSSES